MQYSQESDHLRFEQVSLDDLPTVAQLLLEHSEHPTNLLEAPMGSGKTTLCNAIVEAWGSVAAGSSPTFSLIEEHRGPNGLFYHMDAYRIEDESEAYDFGLEEYFESNVPMWIEWASRVESFLPYKVGLCRIIMGEDMNSRTVLFWPNVKRTEINWNHG